MSERTPVYLYVNETLADWEPGHAVAHIARPDHQRDPERYEVRTVAPTTDPVRTMAGITIVPDTTLAEIDPAEAGMLILAGGLTWERGRHDELMATVGRFLDAGTPVAAICGATFALAAAGFLDERDHTSNDPGYLAASGYAGGGRYRDAKSVTDGGVITASGTDPVDFAKAIFAELDLYSPAALEAWHGLYTTGEPEYFAALQAA